MKKLYIQILTVVIFIGISMSGFGQINRELIKLDKGEFIILDDTAIISKGINPPCDCKGCCEIPNFRFTDPSLAALRNHEASQLAAEAEFHAWVNTQKNIMKQEIERQLGKDFSNFEEAQKTFFKSFEIPNVKIESQSLSPKYNSKVNVKQGVRALCLTEIKKLDLRAAEINSGNISNSRYGNLRYKSTPLNEITSLSQLNTFRAQEVNEFTDNQWRLDQEVRIQNQLNNELSNLQNTNHDILNRLSDIQKAYFGQAGNDFDELDHMQQYLVANIFVFNGPVLPPWDKVRRFGTRDYIEPYVWEKNPAHLSIFHDDFWSLRIQSDPWNTNYWLQRREHDRAEALAQALNEVSTEDILADGAIAALGSTNEDFIKAKPELYNEVSQYFKVNKFSQVSSDCVNYLLNQYHNGGDFAANPNLYKSANTPLYQNAQNPNRALEWKPGTQAINEGITYFGNVLYGLFKYYPNPVYEGYIIRNMFGVNSLNVNASIQTEWLGSGFYFKKNNGASVAIDFNDNNGLDILSQGSNTTTYLTNLVEGVSTKLSGLNAEGKRFLFLKPKRIENANKFILDNNTTIGKNFIKQSLQIFGSNLTEAEKAQQFELAYNTFDPLLPPSLQQNDYEAKIRESARYFKLYGNPEFGNYLESLLPLPSTFSQDDYYALYSVVRGQTKNLVWDYVWAIVGVTIESFQPVIELALWEVGGGLALKVLQKLPLRYLSVPIKNVITRLLASSSQAFSNFKHAKKYGIKTFSELGKVFTDLGITRALEKVQFHHLIEQRFVNNIAVKNWIGSSTNAWKSIVLTIEEHQVFTNAWKNAIARDNQINAGWTGAHTSTATLEQIKTAAREIYKNYPEILQALGL